MGGDPHCAVGAHLGFWKQMCTARAGVQEGVMTVLKPPSMHNVVVVYQLYGFLHVNQVF
jgi:hypothetical protein